MKRTQGMGSVCGAYRVGYVAGQALQGANMDGSNLCSGLFRQNAPQQACMRGFENASSGNSTFDLTSLSCPMRNQPTTPVEPDMPDTTPDMPGVPDAMSRMRRY
jgi:hypothetical protein